MDLGIKGKTALITGASKGIGKAIAIELAKAGCNCIITARNKSPLIEVAKECETYGIQVLPIVSDVTINLDRKRLIDQVSKRFDSIDILINNAGGIDKILSFEEITQQQWVDMFKWNVFSVIEMIRLVIPYMQQKKWGRIINIASESGIQPDALFPHYNAAKAAVLNLTKSLSKTYAPDNILINAVSPAFVRTEQLQERANEQAKKLGQPVEQVINHFLEKNRSNIELKRMGQPEEIAATVAFLASQRASFILGSSIRVDGGSVGVI